MAKHLLIEGRVQGVGYRVSFADKARALGLAGWVCNRMDGSVEAVVAGDAAALEALLAWARQGPPAAKVRKLSVEDVAEPAGAAEFKIHPTK
jgi:acylphosphatase